MFSKIFVYRRSRTRSPRDYEGGSGQSASKMARTSSPDIAPVPSMQPHAPETTSAPPSIASIMGNKPTPGFAGRYSDSEDEEFEPDKNIPGTATN